MPVAGSGTSSLTLSGQSASAQVDSKPFARQPPSKAAIAPAAAYTAALTSQQTCWQPAIQPEASHSFSEPPPRTTFIQTDPCIYAKDNGGPREGTIQFFPLASRGPA